MSDSKWVLIPRGRDAGREQGEDRIDMMVEHTRDFLEAIRANRPSSSLTNDAFVSTAAVQLAMIAYETGVKLQWNGATGELTGPPAAQQLLQRPYRAPWRRPV